MTQSALPAILVTSLGTRAPIASPFGAAWVDPGFYSILRWGTTDGSGAMDAAIQIPNWVPRGLPFTIQGLAIDPATNGLVLGSPAVAHVL
ncbi:MAG: hypothetical protein NXI31_12580 [bacterium]|nr:hypothetical protein [bacterium]